MVCTHITEGHSRAVLAIYATDDILFSASKGWLFILFIHTNV